MILWVLAFNNVATLLLQELGVTALHVKLRATGGNKTKTPGPGAQSALRALARSGLKIGRIGAVLFPLDHCCLRHSVPTPCWTSSAGRVRQGLSHMLSQGKSNPAFIFGHDVVLVYVCDGCMCCRGCDPHPHRCNSQEGWTSWTPLVNSVQGGRHPSKVMEQTRTCRLQV